MRLILLWLAAVLTFVGTAAHAAYPPRPEGPVFDQADVLPPAQEAALDARLREYNQRTGRALIVATVASLDGEAIEPYATHLFELWGIGGKELDQGLLLLVAPTERKVRIETGYGLHQYVPDVISGRVIRNDIAPRFKAGDMPGGIEAGVNALITQLDRSPADAQAIAEAAAAAEAQRGTKDGASAGGVIFWIFLIIFFAVVFGRRRSGFRRSGIDPGIVLWGVSELVRGMSDGDHGGSGWGGGGSSGGGFGGFGGGMSGGGGASGSW